MSKENSPLDKNFFTPKEDLMKHAIFLALRAGGKTHPNPLVGAVIEKDGHILGEGYHKEYGDFHAEREAILDAKKKGFDIKGSTLYVTLEPCCHQGKQPPCTKAIIEEEIKTVVIGSRDPNPLVNGKGVKELKKAKINVIQDFLKDECDNINEVFFYYIKHKRPFVTVKIASSADGKTSLSTGESKWITGETSREYVHFLRGTNMAVMCGIGTVIKDDPLLNCRLEDLSMKQPSRVIIDRELKIPTESRLVKTALSSPLFIFTVSKDKEKKLELSKKGVQIFDAHLKGEHIDIESVLDTLGEKGIDSVLVESGGGLNSSLFFSKDEKKCLVNRVLLFIAPKIFGGKTESIHTGVQGEECKSLSSCVHLSNPKTKMFGDDILIEYKVL